MCVRSCHFTVSSGLADLFLFCICSVQHCWMSTWARLTAIKNLNKLLYLLIRHHFKIIHVFLLKIIINAAILMNYETSKKSNKNIISCWKQIPTHILFPLIHVVLYQNICWCFFVIINNKYLASKIKFYVDSI